MSKSVPSPAPEGGFETEIKFSVSPENIDLIKASRFFPKAEVWQTRTLASIYFDTAGLALRKHGITLRVRRQPGQAHLMGLKSPAGGKHLFRRREVEVPVAAERPELDKLPPGLARKIEALTAGEPLLDQFEIVLHRQAARLRHLTSEIEVALDQGTIMAAGRQVPLCEVELELKSGRAADLCDLALQLAGELPVSLTFNSKAHAGYQALAPQRPEAFRAAPLAFPKHATAAETISAVLASAVSQITKNWQAAEHAGDPEPLHQLRIGLRRLRSALGLFSRSFSLASFGHLKKRANAVMGQLNAARDFDVAIAAVNAADYRALMPVGSHNALLVALENRRIEAYSRANIAIKGKESSELILALCLHLAEAPGKASERARGKARRKRMIAALNRMHRRALKQGRHLAGAAPHELHKLRIMLKNLRYACEVLAPLLPAGRKEAAFMKSLQALLALLGHCNDIAAMNGMMLEIPLSAQPELHQAAGFVLGWNAHEYAAAQLALAKLWKDFAGRKAFWG